MHDALEFRKQVHRSVLAGVLRGLWVLFHHRDAVSTWGCCLRNSLYEMLCDPMVS